MSSLHTHLSPCHFVIGPQVLVLEPQVLDLVLVLHLTDLSALLSLDQV